MESERKRIDMGTIKIACCYAHEDQPLLLKLKEHLAPLEHAGYIIFWADINIFPGEEWERELRTHLNTSQIILILVSSSFIASDYCYHQEMQHALQLHLHGKARVIPIILTPVRWQVTPLGALQALPQDAKPITAWRDKNEALINVAEGVERVVKEIRKGNAAANRVDKEFPLHNDLLNQPPSVLRNHGDIHINASVTGDNIVIGHGGTTSVRYVVPGDSRRSADQAES
jgi:hypothetical protein